MRRKILLFLAVGIFLATECSAQFHIAHKDIQLQNSPAVGSGAVISVPTTETFLGSTFAIYRSDSAAAGGAPTIGDIQPRAQVANGKVLISGTNFDGHTTVTFGGIPAKSVTVNADGKTLTAVIGKNGGSKVVVTNGHGSGTADADLNFTFIPLAPTITSVLPSNSVAGSKVIIEGTNFTSDNLKVSFKKADGVDPVLLSSTGIWVEIPAGVTGDTVSVSTNGGVAVYPAKANALDANADLTVPNLGQGITIIPTPTFTYTSVHAHNCFTFSSSIWANSFATDSNRQAVGSKLLLAQTSLFGFKVAGNLRFTNAQSDLNLSLYGEENILVKKVGYYDMSAKTNTNFNPLVLQTRVGPTVSLFNSIFLGVYENILSVESQNANVSAFFQTGGKNVFAYPEIDAAGIFPLSKGSSQQIKAEIDLIVNNKDADYFYSSGNSVIPYFKLGFVTGL